MPILQESEGDAIAARKLTVLFDVVDADQKAPRSRGEEPAVKVARRREALLKAGEGADDALADALLWAV